jgi:hypothetical protein
MKSISQTIGILMLLSFVSCSKPTHFLFLNDSGRTIIINGNFLPSLAIAPGDFAELQFDPTLQVSWGGTSHRYAWKFPLPASDFMEFGKPTERFAVSLESNGSVYARKIANGRPSDTLPHQPEGFPLTSH